MTDEADTRVGAEIRSVTPGRIRLKVAARHRDVEELQRLEKALEGRPEIAGVRTNPVTGSIILRYIPQQLAFEELQAALADAGVDVARESLPADRERTGAGRARIAAGALNRSVRAATGGGDLRLILPIGLAALSLRQALRDVPGLDRAPWYLLAWYSFDSFLKLNERAIARFTDHGATGSTPGTPAR